MSHIDKKARIIDRRAQITVTHNLDLMAIISSFLEWGEIAKYVRVCKAWNKSFLTRYWGSPSYLYLPFRSANYYRRAKLGWKETLPVNTKYIQLVKKIGIMSDYDNIIEMIHQIKINGIFIFGCGVNYVTKLHLLKHLKLKEIEITHSDQDGLLWIKDFIEDHKQSLTKLIILGVDDYIDLPEMPNLIELNINSGNKYNDNVGIDIQLLHIKCPNLEKIEIEYRPKPHYSKEQIIKTLEKTYEVLANLPIKELVISCEEFSNFDHEEFSCSLPIIKIPILLRSKTLKKIYIEILGKLEGDCMFIRRIDPKICKVKVAGLQDQYDVIEN